MKKQILIFLLFIPGLAFSQTGKFTIVKTNQIYSLNTDKVTFVDSVLMPFLRVTGFIKAPLFLINNTDTAETKKALRDTALAIHTRTTVAQNIKESDTTRWANSGGLEDLHDSLAYIKGQLKIYGLSYDGNDELLEIYNTHDIYYGGYDTRLIVKDSGLDSTVIGGESINVYNSTFNARVDGNINLYNSSRLITSFEGSSGSQPNYLFDTFYTKCDTCSIILVANNGATKLKMKGSGDLIVTDTIRAPYLNITGSQAKIGNTVGFNSFAPLEITNTDDAGLAITTTSTAGAGLTETYVAGFIPNSAGTLKKVGALDWRWADKDATNGYASWNIHTTAATGGVTNDYYGLAVWAKHGAAFFPPAITSGYAPGLNILKINGVLYSTDTLRAPYINIKGTNDKLSFSSPSTEAYKWHIYRDNTSTGNLFMDETYASSTTTKLIIESNTGNVGIGKTPSTKLDVNGQIKSLQISAALTDGTPTDSELDTATGLTPSAVGAGWQCFIKDSDGTGLVYRVYSDGTYWYYQAMTKAL